MRVIPLIVEAITATTGHGANVEMEHSVLQVTKCIAVLLHVPIVSCTGREPPRFATVNAAIVAQAMIAY